MEENEVGKNESLKRTLEENGVGKDKIGLTNVERFVIGPRKSRYGIAGRGWGGGYPGKERFRYSEKPYTSRLKRLH